MPRPPVQDPQPHTPQALSPARGSPTHRGLAFAHRDSVSTRVSAHDPSVGSTKNLVTERSRAATSLYVDVKMSVGSVTYTVSQSRRGLEPAPQGVVHAHPPTPTARGLGTACSLLAMRRPGPPRPAGAACACPQSPPGEGCWGTRGGRGPELPAAGEPLLGVRSVVSGGAAASGRSSCPSHPALLAWSDLPWADPPAFLNEE